MRAKWLLAAAGLALAACGNPSAPAGGAGGTVAPAAHADAPGWVRDQWATLPDWNFIANISDGGKASFSPHSIHRQNGMADVQVQILHLDPQPYKQETATTVETTWYIKERATYRFNCSARTYFVTERQYLGPADAVAGSDHYEPKGDADWRSIDDSGLALVLEGPICKAA